MSDKQLELECRLTVIEHLVQKLYATQLMAADDPVASTEGLIRQWRESAPPHLLGNLNDRDQAAAELQKQGDRILAGIKAILERGR